MRDRFQLPLHVGSRTPSLEGTALVTTQLFVKTFLHCVQRFRVSIPPALRPTLLQQMDNHGTRAHTF